MAVILETSLGDICIDLYTEERPRCCLSFLKLCKVKYFNFHLFYSVQKNSVAQSGDPEGNGRGGESIYRMLYGEQAKYFEAEVKPRIKHKKKGMVSMVNDGQGMHGSQFFITMADGLDYLDGQGHTVFGEVSEGMDTLDKINEVYCDDGYKPYQNIRIYHTVVLDDPYDDPAGLECPEKSPEPDREKLDNGRIEAGEDINPHKGKTEEEITEIMEEKEARANAQILEMVGDLPDQEMAPPENVLFVCKLNSVTTDEDLEIIFSRFGNIVNCDVIRDQKTGESLQYAFIEFDNKESCEAAYFKMDNVLIDDRRIHVDFSQSVSHLKWQGKGRGVENTDSKKSSRKESAFRIHGSAFGGTYSGSKSSKSERKRSRDDKGNGDRRRDSPSNRRHESDSSKRQKQLERSPAKVDYRKGHQDRSRSRSRGHQGSSYRDRSHQKSVSPIREKRSNRRRSRSRSRSNRRDQKLSGEERRPTKESRQQRSLSPHDSKSKVAEKRRSKDRDRNARSYPDDQRMDRDSKNYRGERDSKNYRGNTSPSRIQSGRKRRSYSPEKSEREEPRGRKGRDDRSPLRAERTSRTVTHGQTSRSKQMDSDTDSDSAGRRRNKQTRQDKGEYGQTSGHGKEAARRARKRSASSGSDTYQKKHSSKEKHKKHVKSKARSRSISSERESRKSKEHRR